MAKSESVVQGLPFDFVWIFLLELQNRDADVKYGTIANAAIQLPPPATESHTACFF
jgi:hypothetical protein